MDASEMIESLRELIELNYESKLHEAFTKGKPYLVVDFKKIIRHSPELGEALEEDSDNFLQAFKIAIERFDVEGDTKNFTIRIKNVPASYKLAINNLRSKNLDKFLVVEGMIKQKSEVKPHISTIRYECPSCGNIITVLQLDEKIKEPTTCGCGRKGKFRVISKELVDVFTMMIEELTENMIGGTKLAKVRILCRDALTLPEIERKLFQGGRIEVSGILKEIYIVGRDGGKTTKLDWYIDANYIKIFDETFLDIKWNKEDVEEFDKLSQKKDWLARLRKSIFYDIHGYEEESEGIILQMFSGVGKDREGANIRGNFHILLVGDPGTSKSTMLKIAHKFAPKANYTAGSGVTAAGLTAAVVRDEITGGWTLEAGALVLCNNGICIIDELDKVDPEHKKALHEPLSEETVSVNKANIQATLIAKTSVLAAANPKHGSFSNYDDIVSQIDLSSSLINRFDLVYTIKEDDMTPDDDMKIGMKILSRGSIKEADIKLEYEKEFIKKYISYAKSITPIIPERVQFYMATKYKELKELKRKANEKGQASIPITPRNLDGLRRLTEAVARSRLHKKVTSEDADIAFNKLIYSIKQLGIDLETGEVFEEFIVEGVNKGKPKRQKKDLMARLRALVHQRTATNNETINGLEILAILESEGFEKYDIDEALEKTKRKGDIFEPTVDNWRVL